MPYAKSFKTYQNISSESSPKSVTRVLTLLGAFVSNAECFFSNSHYNRSLVQLAAVKLLRYISYV